MTLRHPLRREGGKLIAIVGGGVSGALTAYHLCRQRINAQILMIDPRPRPGLGLAYATPSLRHLLNVPAGRISALPEEPNHFLNWLRANYDSTAASGDFVPRAVFGRYVQSILSEAGEINHVRASVVDCRLEGLTAVLTLENGCERQADLVVLATGNFDPAPLPGVDRGAECSGAYRHNVWRSDAYGGLAPDAPVTLIGTGLTSIDVLLRLRELGHRGVITAVSRRGVFPERHAEYTPLEEPAVPAATPATCAGYLKALRTTVRNGAEWRAAVDSLRPISNDLWLALSRKEQQRFRRHLQRRWEVVRHRMAPSIADTIKRELAEETLVVREGHLQSVEPEAGEAVVTIRTSKGTDRFHAARVMNCTGPNMRYGQVDSPLLKRLVERGLATAGPLGLGFNSTRSGALVSVDGKASRMFFTLGPARLGTLIESIAVPEIRQQAADLAQALVSDYINDTDSAPVAAA